MSEAHLHEPPTVPFEDLPTRLKLARWKTGLDQEELGNRLGLHRRTVANYETGSTEPKLHLLMAWANLANVPLDWLAFGVHNCPNCGHDLTPEASTGSTCISENALVSESNVLIGDFGQGGDAGDALASTAGAMIYDFPPPALDAPLHV